jgi:hypothetical protein
MGWTAYVTRNVYKFLVAEGSCHLGELGGVGRIILKCSLDKQNVRLKIGFTTESG